MRRLLVVALLLALSPAKAYENVSFLEAALFFMTNIEPQSGDEVTPDQITIHSWPIVAYTVKDNPCAIRIRMTQPPYSILQFDFCQITHWGVESGSFNRAWYWMGHKTAFCTYRNVWDATAGNYDGPINDQNAKCGQSGPTPTGEHLAYRSTWEIQTLFYGKYSQRDVGRMVSAYKYIESMLAAKPY
jgi:hypothetical protein